MAEQELETEEIERVEDTPPEPSPEELAQRQEMEAEAKKYGWRPKEEFDRAPEGWVDAERFMELPQTHVKMLRDETRDLKAQLERGAQEIEGIRRMSRVAVDEARKQAEAQYERDLAVIRAGQRKAVEDMDTERFDALAQREAQLRQNAPQAAPVDAPQVDQAEIAKVEAYKRDNEWTQNPIIWGQVMSAIDNSPEVMALPADKQIEYADKMVRQSYPHLFAAPEPKPAAVQRVDGGGLGLGAKRSKGANDLPSEAAKIGKEFVEEGIFKSLDDYAKQYFAQGG
jgi:hypothetical protein